MFNFCLLVIYFQIFIFSKLWLYFFFVTIIKIVCILIAVAYYTIAERKVMAAIQRRVGPNVEGGPFGLLQPLADGLKLFIKELIIPSRANIFIFLFSPILVFILSLIS
jgi:NADH:ubiquinone oxidoreductase subunit H